MKNLGWQNGWKEEPEIVRKCREARKRGEEHDMSGSGKGPWSCTHVVTCKTCEYTYQYDSGD